MTESLNDDRLDHLLSALVDAALSPSESDELTERLRTDPAARQTYIAWMTLDARLRVRHAAPVKIPGQTLPAPHNSQSTAHTPHSTFRISRVVAIAALVAFIAIGILPYTFWPSPTQQPVVKQIPAAKIANLTDAKWVGVSSQAGDTLIAGQQLLLQSGTAEITFNSQARVIVDGPAELTIVDARTCRLATGRLTAHVPNPAKGFKVHTPDGTVTDLGTEFGVLVSPQQGNLISDLESPAAGLKSPGITEVHVFKGQVNVAKSEVGGDRGAAVAGQPDSIAQPPTSDLRLPASRIVSAGQAVAIRPAGMESLSAADPFLFRAEGFDGRRRQTLLADDFESLAVGDSGRVIDRWTTEYTNAGRGQINVIDPRAAEKDAPGATAILPPVGQRAMEISNSIRVTKHLYPLLSSALDRQQMAAPCKLLVQCDISPRTPNIEPSIQLSSEAPLRFAPGIALDRSPNHAVPPLAWQVKQWYRIRAVWDMVDGAPQGAAVERLMWRGAEGWVRDTSVRLPAPPEKLSPIQNIVFGFPASLSGRSGGTYWLDNVRVEVLEAN